MKAKLQRSDTDVRKVSRPVDVFALGLHPAQDTKDASSPAFTYHNVIRAQEEERKREIWQI